MKKKNISEETISFLITTVTTGIGVLVGCCKTCQTFFSNQIGRHHPHFVFHSDFHLLCISATSKNSASQRWHNQRNVVESKDKTEPPWAWSSLSSQQMLSNSKFKISFCAPVTWLWHPKVPWCTVWELWVSTVGTIVSPLRFCGYSVCTFGKNQAEASRVYSV